MISEQQFYEAKVFLRAYNSAIACLENATKQKYEVDLQRFKVDTLNRLAHEGRVELKEGSLLKRRDLGPELKSLF